MLKKQNPGLLQGFAIKVLIFYAVAVGDSSSLI